MAQRQSLLLTAGLILLLTGATQANGGREAATPTPIVTDAKRVIHLLETGEFSELTARWDSTMQHQLPAPKVKEFWTQLEAQVGKLREVGTPAVEREGAYQTVVIPLEFERATVEVSVTYNGRGQVAGIYFRPKS